MKQQIVTVLAILSFFRLATDAVVAEGTSIPVPPFAGKVDFLRDIQPLFADRCYSCHGPEKQKSGLRLDIKERALSGGDSGKSIVPGRSAKSLLYRYVAHLDPEIKMPPKGEALPSKQVALIQQWIDQGAPWPADTKAASAKTLHWSFQPPKRSTLPLVKNKRWIQNPIDQFVLAKLENHRITPSPEADRPTLIRRLSLDLIGLPPTPEQVKSFATDRRSDAYDRLVESLLCSPHFGERWGRHWLDLARYADSEGYQVDRARPCAYVFRDWVIDAINRDLPYDEFTIEQIAGDLLPNATPSQRIAVGFHRNTLMNHEDGIDREEFRCKARSDRVATTGTAWLGLTLGCAECHTHKYDPITQREFYALYSFFNNAEELDLTAPLPAQSFRQLTNCVKTFVHVRGDFLRKGEEARPGVLSVLHPFKPRSANPDRLDLANWLVDPANPLASRVAVNHIWQHLFGKGLVSTPEDFGVRGEPPSHPHLLDWLATEFIRCGWSRKEIIRLIVTSATYRQSANARPELASLDSNNTLLARQNRFRVESEIVRDLFLLCGGLLKTDLKGPSFHPSTTADFKALGGAGAFTWVDTEGPEKYRRGVYVFEQRTVPYPVSATFDAANPNESCPRRESSNTPLQALTLLNNPIFFEATQGLARRMLRATGSDRDRIVFGFKLCLAREPSREELLRLRQLYETARRSALQNPPAAAKMVANIEADSQKIADAAACLLVAQVLTNLEEFLTRE